VRRLMTKRKSDFRKTLTAYCFMAPALILFTVFILIPIITSLPLAFCDYSVLGETKFIGLNNFTRAFNDPEFKIAIFNSILFVVIVPPIQILSILLAILVNKKLRGISFFRVLFYIPVVTSMVAVSIIWGFLFDPNGIINTLLMNWGIIQTPFGFLQDSSSAMGSIMFITIWQGLGYYMMLYLSGLQSIPAEMEEAARVDGANKFVSMVKIKLPLMKPYIWFCTLNSIISAVGVFDIVYVLTKGGPDNSTMVMNYYSYFKAFNDYEFGYSAAVGLVLAVITSILSIIVFVYGKQGGGMTYND
jgi:putative chitobiose transport system permease protein